MDSIRKHDCGFNYDLYPVSEGSKAKSLVVMFLGYGLTLDRWAKRSRNLKESLPDSAVVTVEGNVPATDGSIFKDGIPSGYSWMDIDTRAGLQEIIKQGRTGSLTVVKEMNKFINNRISEQKLTHDKVGLIGYSMGGFMSLQVAFNSSAKYGAVVSLAAAMLPNTEFKSKPEVFYSIGNEDPIFKSGYMDKNLFKPSLAARKIAAITDDGTERRMRREGISLTLKRYDSVRHLIPPEMWNEGVEFLNKKLNHQPQISL